MPIYFAGRTRSPLFTYTDTKFTDIKMLKRFAEVTFPQLIDIQIGKHYLLLWQSERLFITSSPDRYFGFASTVVQVPNPAANEHCKLVAPHYGENKISILTTNNVFWEYDINEDENRNWRSINIFTPKSSEHAVKIAHCNDCNMLLTNLGRLLTMHDRKEIESNVKFIDIAYSDGLVILLGEDSNVYKIEIEKIEIVKGYIWPMRIIGPTLIPFEAKIVQIAAGTTHYAAITDQGHLYTWGSNSHGQLAIRTRGGDILDPVLAIFDDDGINTVNKIKKVECGDEFTICLKDDGTLWGAGSNECCEFGQEDILHPYLHNISCYGIFIRLDMQWLGGKKVEDFKCNESGTAIITK